MQKITVTKSLIFINFVVMLILLWESQSLNSVDIKVLKKIGGVHDGLEGCRTVAYIFLHANIFHIVMNMIALMNYGKKLEQRFGALFGLVYYKFKKNEFEEELLLQSLTELNFKNTMKFY